MLEEWQQPAQIRARVHHKHKQARIVMLASLQEPAQTQARMHHKYKHARNINPLFGGSLEGCGCFCRLVLEVASFVPGHVRNRGATPWSWTALCSKKNQGGHTFGLGPHGSATLGCSNRSQRRRRTNKVPPSRLMEPMPRGGDGVYIFIFLFFPFSRIQIDEDDTVNASSCPRE